MHRRHDKIAKLLLWVMALGWLVAPLHFIDGEHHWCPEHDQFEHSESEHGGAIPASAPNASRKIAAFQTELPSAAASGEHEACQVLGALTRSKAVPTPDDAKAIERPTADLAAISAAPDFHPAEFLLTIAPKQGPPA